MGQQSSRRLLLSSVRLYGRAERRIRKKSNRDKSVEQRQDDRINPEEVYGDDEIRGFGSSSAGQGQMVENDVVLDESEEDSKSSTLAGPETQLDDIFKKYGIEESKATQATESQKRAILAGKEPKSEGGAFGESVLSKLDGKLQQKIDNTLISLTFGSLLFCVLCGLAISSSAIEVVFPDFKMDQNVDYVLKDVLTPFFYSLYRDLLFFSITFGIFKFAQVSSQATVYTEEPEGK